MSIIRMNSFFPNRWSISYLKFTKYVTNIIAEPKYKYGQQEQVTIRNHNVIIPASRYIKALPDKLPNISPQCSRMSLNTMRGKPGQQFSIYCTFQDHIQPTLTGHFQFKVQNYGIAYRRILETAHQSIGLIAN